MKRLGWNALTMFLLGCAVVVSGVEETPKPNKDAAGVGGAARKTSDPGTGGEKPKAGAHDRPGALKSIELLGARDQAIVARDPAVSTFQFQIPARIEPAEAAAQLTLRTVSVSLGGRSLDPATVEFRAKPQSTTIPELIATVDLQKANEAGTYAVKVLAASSAQGDTPPIVLDFSLTRPPAELRIGSPVRLERVVMIPRLWEKLTPGVLIVGETSGKSAVNLANSDWIVDLHRSEGSLIAGRIRADLPHALSAGGQGQASLRMSAGAPLGKATGTIAIRAPQLAMGVFEAPVEVVSRLSLAWLIVALAGGIAAGWRFRTRLDSEKRRFQARIAANERIAAIDDMIGKTIDPGLLEALKASRTKVAISITPEASPDAIEAAAKEAGAEVQAQLKDADARRSALRTRIATLRTALGPVEGQPAGARQVLEEALRALARLEADLNAGAIDSVNTALSEEENALPNRIREAVETWAESVKASIGRMGEWPNTPLAAVLSMIEPGPSPLDNSNSDPYKVVLPATITLARRVRIDLLREGMDDVERIAGDVSRKLTELNEPALQPPLERLARVLNEFRAARAGASAESLTSLAEAVKNLRDTLKTVLEVANPTPGEALFGLDQGDFPKALKDVLAKRTPKPRETVVEEERATLVPTMASPAPTRPAEAIPDIATWTLRIATPPGPVAGRPLPLNVAVVTTEGHPAPVISLRWFVDGQLEKEGRPADLDFTTTPRNPGTLSVRVEAVANRPPPRSAEITIFVLPREGAEALPEDRASLRRIENQQTLVAGLLIAAVGFGIFKASFIGTFEDFLSVILWGFSVDIGVAKVRELGAPFLNRANPSAVVRP